MSALGSVALRGSQWAPLWPFIVEIKCRASMLSLIVTRSVIVEAVGRDGPPRARGPLRPNERQSVPHPTGWRLRGGYKWLLIVTKGKGEG